MKHYLLTSISLVLLFNFNAFALQSDLQQEVIISAKNQQADIKNNQMIFNGPVKVTQGSITITAQTLRAYSKASEHKILIAIGDPATYSQKMDNGLMASASANKIQYDLSTRVLHLTGNAVLEQSGNKVNSNTITYDILQQKLTAQSGGQNNERVTTIIKTDQIQNKSSVHSINKETSTPSSVDKTKKTNAEIDSEQQTYSSIKESPLPVTPSPVNKNTSANRIHNASMNKQNWYIQVGAFSKQSSMNKLIKNIQNSGFEYTVHPDNINEKPISRLLIGPYQTLSSAKKDINRVKFEIEKDAYFYKIR
ncbi:lipopolysaccharide transport periplasmic protein LptA [uncultured Shewanella sp.]|uniref:lipopolysaccharide transport periplasmic protein LptA n=1 Tax=uncultured Shewanella sp. TaxID=173975 RepID=UPI0026161FB5|nr:lipopolysaccharide transport periplasmic protein LptA [uncultured Shewanella sp.]